MTYEITATTSKNETIKFTAKTIEQKWQIERELNEAGVSHTKVAK